MPPLFSLLAQFILVCDAEILPNLVQGQPKCTICPMLLRIFKEDNSRRCGGCSSWKEQH